VLLNPRLDARRACEVGLVTAVYPNETFEAEVKQMAATIAAGPSEAFAAAKELMNQAAGMSGLDPHLDRELEYLSRSADRAEFAIGIESFFAKRVPRFLKNEEPRTTTEERRPKNDEPGTKADARVFDR
jgi:enoyl-CoA hydratase/carnithine racemase